MMSNPVARVVSTGRYGDDSVPTWRTLYVWCPACDTLTGLPVPGEDGALPPSGPHWEWNGDLVRPTVEPSILQHQQSGLPLCHSYLRDGVWEFLGDCTHELAGRTAEMVPLPDWVMGQP